jgi:hypothetical protein
MGRTALTRNSRSGLRTKAAALYAGVSNTWLAADRLRVLAGKPGYGPPFRLVGTEFRYDPADIDAWRERNRFDPANPPRRSSVATA